jgi:CBS domain-containing protein
MMVEYDCGEIPVLDGSGRPVGTITDRDITCRTVAMGRNPLALSAVDCMSSPVITLTPDMDLDECCDILEAHQIRRAPVVDADGQCCGIVSQADIADRAPVAQVAEVVREVSRPAQSVH